MEKIRHAASQFRLCSEPTDFTPYGNGHINDTFLLTCEENGAPRRYILQTVNTNVFKKPEQVMRNIEKVIGFLRERVCDPHGVMTLIPTRSGASYYIDGDGRCWRVYDFIENSVCLEHPESAEDFRQCAVAFGRFQHDLGDFPADSLYETIPDFHNTPSRYRDFLAAVERDACGRADGVREEIAFLRERADFYSVLYDAHRAGRLPLRVTHNDTKSNNVMLDGTTRKALCVIDLDTIMPGFSVTDFGDAIRFGASTAAEDERDLARVSLDLDMFDIYTAGYLEGCGGQLGASEIMLCPEGAKMMTLECGMRFLADYLDGDTYFKTAYAEHNLVRCRTQLKLAADMEVKWDEMKRIVQKYIEG